MIDINQAYTPGGSRTTATGPTSPMVAPMDLAGLIRAELLAKKRPSAGRGGGGGGGGGAGVGTQLASLRPESAGTPIPQDAEERIQLTRELSPGGFNVLGHYGSLGAGGGSASQVNAGSMSPQQFAAMLAMRPERQHVIPPGPSGAALTPQSASEQAPQPQAQAPQLSKFAKQFPYLSGLVGGQQLPGQYGSGR